MSNFNNIESLGSTQAQPDVSRSRPTLARGLQCAIALTLSDIVTTLTLRFRLALRGQTRACLVSPTKINAEVHVGHVNNAAKKSLPSGSLANRTF